MSCALVSASESEHTSAERARPHTHFPTQGAQAVRAQLLSPSQQACLRFRHITGSCTYHHRVQRAGSRKRVHSPRPCRFYPQLGSPPSPPSSPPSTSHDHDTYECHPRHRCNTTRAQPRLHPRHIPRCCRIDLPVLDAVSRTWPLPRLPLRGGGRCPTPAAAPPPARERTGARHASRISGCPPPPG